MPPVAFTVTVPEQFCVIDPIVKTLGTVIDCVALQPL